MYKKDRRLPLGGLASDDDDLGRIREYGLRRGFIPTEIGQADAGEPAAPPPTVSLPTPAPTPVPLPLPAVASLSRPAATRPWQAMFPDYLIEALRKAAAEEGTAQKVIVMRALRQAGFRVDDLDLQDLRRR
jgi:hypothetical protein